MTRDELRALIHTHQAEICRYLGYLGADPATVDDLAQDTFVSAFGAARSPAPGDVRAEAAWLRTIARNHFLMLCRRRRASPVRASLESLTEAEDVWQREFLRDGDGFDYVEALRRCLETLSGRMREAVTLRYTERAPRERMAERLEMTEDGVKTILRRAREALGQCVRQRLAQEGAE